jgi:hypothetical protein
MSSYREAPRRELARGVEGILEPSGDRTVGQIAAEAVEPVAARFA